MAIDVQYTPIIAELPDVVEREQVVVYLPIATNDGKPGIMAIDTEHFQIIDGKLYIRIATVDNAENPYHGVAKFDHGTFNIDENGVVHLNDPLTIEVLNLDTLNADAITLDGNDLQSLLNGKVRKYTGSSQYTVYCDINGTVANIIFTDAPTGDTMMYRNAQGRSQVANPSANKDIANKEYVDAQDASKLAEAESDATSKANAAESNANTYTDNKVAGEIFPSRVKTQRLEIGAMDVKLSIEALQANDEDQDEAIAGKISSSEKGTAGGVATLDESGKVPVAQLPSYVSDVIEYPTLSAFPAVGERNKIYVALDTNFTYRWSGTQYTQIGGGASGGRWVYVGDEDEHTVPSELSIGGIFYERM